MSLNFNIGVPHCTWGDHSAFQTDYSVDYNISADYAIDYMSAMELAAMPTPDAPPEPIIDVPPPAPPSPDPGPPPGPDPGPEPDMQMPNMTPLIVDIAATAAEAVTGIPGLSIVGSLINIGSQIMTGGES